MRCDRVQPGDGVYLIFDSSVCYVKSSPITSEFSYSILQVCIVIAGNIIKVICCYLSPSLGVFEQDIVRMNSFITNLQPLL